MRTRFVGLAIALWLCAAPAQAQQVRLAAPADCLVNPGCAVGLKSAYGLDVPAAGLRVVVRDAGLRPQLVRAIRRDRVDLFPAYSGSLLRYLVGSAPERLAAGLRRTPARIDVEPMRL